VVMADLRSIMTMVQLKHRDSRYRITNCRCSRTS
jgi:hypothetical protein